MIKVSKTVMCSGRVERAGRALVWLRGGSRDSVQDELNTIQLNLAADRAASQAGHTRTRAMGVVGGQGGATQNLQR